MISWILVYIGATLVTIQKSTPPSTGMHTRKIIASLGLIQKERIIPITKRDGPLVTGRNPAFTIFWITVTSVVILVITEEVTK